MNYAISDATPRRASDCVGTGFSAPPNLELLWGLILFITAAMIAPVLFLCLIIFWLAVTSSKTPDVLVFLSRFVPRRVAQILINSARMLRIAERKSNNKRRLFT